MPSRWNGARVEVAYYEERRPSKDASLKPSEVCKAFGATCARYGARVMVGDLHYAETAREELGKLRLADQGE